MADASSKYDLNLMDGQCSHHVPSVGDCLASGPCLYYTLRSVIHTATRDDALIMRKKTHKKHGT